MREVVGAKHNCYHREWHIAVIPSGQMRGSCRSLNSSLAPTLLVPRGCGRATAACDTYQKAVLGFGIYECHKGQIHGSSCVKGSSGRSCSEIRLARHVYVFALTNDRSAEHPILCHHVPRVLARHALPRQVSNYPTSNSPNAMNDILEGLNTAQREAVTSDASVLQVLAPPGSGKTKTLTARVAYLIAHRHLKPWNIVVCTFTVKAAREMQQRIRLFIGEELEKKLNIGTFHGIALRYLRKYGNHVGLGRDFGVADTGDSMAIVKRIIKQKDLTADAGKTRSRISSEKAKGNDSERFAQTVKKNDVALHEFSQIFTEYQATLAACNLLDYDDLLSTLR